VARAVVAGGAEEAMEAVRAGRPVVVVDDVNGGEHADLVVAAERATTENIAFTIRHTSGVVCVAMQGSRLDALDLPPMVHAQAGPAARAFTVSVDYRHGTTTGISALERALTLRALSDEAATAGDFARPGHVFPLRSHPGGLFDRPSHTEAALDLVRLAGAYPAAVLAELVDETGELAGARGTAEWAQRFGLPVLSFREVLRHRVGAEPVVTWQSRARIPSPHGELVAHAFRSVLDDAEHLALVKGDVSGRRDILFRIQPECVLGDVFRSAACSCRGNLEAALAAIDAAGAGVIVYVRPGRPSGGWMFGGPGAAVPGLDCPPLDERGRLIAAGVAGALGVERVRLITDEPGSAAALGACGVRVAGEIVIGTGLTVVASSA
jgi:3,4-dihydroxy 2-butanone 4-phosphate synthase/GTP cyclohydrolase II